MRKSLVVLLVLSLLSQPGWAHELPSLGDVSQQGLTLAQEREIGEEAMREIRRSGDLVDDPEVVAYLSRLGGRLVDAAGASDVRFTFFSVRDKSVNAFAIPGGYVGVHTGLFVVAQHESELASVLAHEIAHVSQHHLARMIDATSVNPLVSLATLGVAILAGRAGRTDAAATAVVAGAGYGAQRELDFTYAFEQEADRIGMQTLIRSGFDPGAMPTFFSRLQQYNRLEESNAPEFLRTHPVTAKRIADAQGRVADLPYRQKPDSADFLFVREKIRGLQSTPGEIVDFYRKALTEKRYANEAAHRYGLAHALYLARDYDAAWLALLQAKATFGRKGHPALEYLAGSIRLGQGRHVEAIALFARAAEAFPSSRALAYGLIDAQAAAGHFDRALSQIADYQSLYPGDPLFYQRAAKIYALQGRSMESHKAQGEYYVRVREYGLAIEQMQTALKQPGNDFYLLSSIEARLRDLEADHKSRKKKS